MAHNGWPGIDVVLGKVLARTFERDRATDQGGCPQCAQRAARTVLTKAGGHRPRPDADLARLPVRPQ